MDNVRSQAWRADINNLPGSATTCIALSAGVFRVMPLLKKARLSVLVCVALLVLYFSVKRFFSYHPERDRREDVVKYNAEDWARKDMDKTKNQFWNNSPLRKLPQVIGIGVKKCGTGALRQFLSHHPQVAMAKSKYGEPHFFDNNSTFKKGRSYYLSLMPYTKGKELTMEITPRYFVAEHVPGRIQEFYDKRLLPELKFIVILCNPTDRLFSEYVHLRSSRPSYHLEKQVQKYRSVSDFTRDALRNVTNVLNEVGSIMEERDNRQFIDYINSYYEVSPLTNGIYIFHLKRWLKYFPRSQILILDGDDLIKRPWVSMNGVQEFLGIEPVIKKESFRYDREKGFYCLERCLSKGKGRTRSGNALLNPPQPPLTAKVRKMLDLFYSRYNEPLFRFINATFSW